MGQAKAWGKETLAGGGLDNKQFNDYVPPDDPLAQFFAKPEHHLDAARAEGRFRLGRRARRAEPRLPEHRPVQRGVAASLPRRCSAANRSRRFRSPRRSGTPPTGAPPRCRRRTWRASCSPARDPHYLKDAPESEKYLGDDAATVERGKVVFAERCARCHSSKLPPLPAGLDLENANGPNYLAAWNAYWAWTKTDGFKTAMRQRRARARLPREQLPVDRAARADHAARHQRLQSARHQRDPQQHLGQLLVGVVQDAALGRHA